MGNSQIIDYYTQSEIDYRMLWDLDKSLALHFGFWDKSTKNLREALENENKVLAKIAKIKKSDLVLDAGCGVGGSSIYLAKKFGCRVIGISIVEKQIKQARENVKKNGISHLVEFHNKDYLKTGFKHGTFDVVWAIESVCHADSKEKFIKEAHRILKKGGRLIVADFWANQERNLDGDKLILDKWSDSWSVIGFETPQNFKKYMNKVGFRKIEFKNVTARILPSSQRLHQMFYPGWIINKLGQFLGFRNDIQTKNLWSAYYQYLAFNKKLAIYGIFYAEE